jgi:hypothetical protein
MASGSGSDESSGDGRRGGAGSAGAGRPLAGLGGGSQPGLGGGVGAAGQVPSLFREAQRFKHWVFYVPVAIVTGVIWWQFIQQIVVGRPVGEEPLPDWLAWALTMVFGLGFPAFAALVRLITEVRPGELSVRLYPFRPALIRLAEVESAESREYSALREYGGYGVRWSRFSGKAYNASGAQGVQLVMKDGQRILIGTQEPERLLAALRTAGVD